MFDRLAGLEARYEELGQFMSDPDIVSDMGVLQKYAREHAELEPIVRLYRGLKETDIGIADARSVQSDGADEELQELALETLEELESRRREQIDRLKQALTPKDPNDTKNAIVEIRAAAGGEEAALFARQLLRMYSLFAEQ